MCGAVRGPPGRPRGRGGGRGAAGEATGQRGRPRGARGRGGGSGRPAGGARAGRGPRGRRGAAGEAAGLRGRQASATAFGPSRRRSRHRRAAAFAAAASVAIVCRGLRYADPSRRRSRQPRLCAATAFGKPRRRPSGLRGGVRGSLRRPSAPAALRGDGLCSARKQCPCLCAATAFMWRRPLCGDGFGRSRRRSQRPRRRPLFGAEAVPVSLRGDGLCAATAFLRQRLWAFAAATAFVRRDGIDLNDVNSFH